MFRRSGRREQILFFLSLVIENFKLTTEIEFENLFYTLKNLNSYLEQLKLMNLTSNECIPIIYMRYCVFDLGICAEDEDFEDALSFIFSLKQLATLTSESQLVDAL